MSQFLIHEAIAVLYNTVDEPITFAFHSIILPFSGTWLAGKEDSHDLLCMCVFVCVCAFVRLHMDLDVGKKQAQHLST